MTMTDPIADMLTRIRNDNTMSHATVDIPASKMKKAIAQILLDEGYIENFEVIDDGVQGTIKVTLKYGANKERVISGIKKISKPGLKVYAKASGRTRYRGYFHIQWNHQRQEGQRTGRRRRSNLLCLVGGSEYVKNRQKTCNASCRSRGQGR